MGETGDVEDVSEILKAIAHPMRRELLVWLKDPDAHFEPGHAIEGLGVCAGQFERCGLSQSTVSSHLATLQRAGLVTATRRGQWIYYQRNEETIARFLKNLGHAL
ncbi:transcriptional regulator, ArsR family [Rhizobium sp. RU20A]|uniref:ArsR/SmtB family transcription factor n=1 Tax=Rhizobium sp. RU20A TaxID=1907412 RepID=UPI0009575412|nr:metalloregulator ArsR/SmtB family transcription factor [Rhizobium sp. RU20A]SIQ25642.1 transcriptional regulator, ArsR family [Rhizobium sp. RU20A]